MLNRFPSGSSPTTSVFSHHPPSLRVPHGAYSSTCRHLRVAVSSQHRPRTPCHPGVGAELEFAEQSSEVSPPSSKSPHLGLGLTQNMRTSISGARSMCWALHRVLCLHMSFHHQNNPVRKAFPGRLRNSFKVRTKTRNVCCQIRELCTTLDCFPT